MADTDLTINQGDQPSVSTPGILHFERILNCADIKGDGSNITLAVNDTAQLFDLPEGIWIIAVQSEVLKAEGGVGTFNLGITGVDVNAYLDAVDANAAVGTRIVSGDAAVDEPTAFTNNGRFLTATETVSFLALAALGTAIIRIIIKAVDMRGQLTDPTL